ncbi:3-dehydroquinate synthase [Romboutsia sp.]|uniref:3-dehydroquinate synthase n=1 Tax=Romboutsia sp. TaxID=1965302 RepID=UPI003F3C1881
MEKIVNKTCNIVIANNYKNFGEALGNVDINSMYDEVLIITDQNVYSNQLHKFTENIKAKSIYEYIVPVGEESKTIEVYEQIMKFCVRINLSRKSLIIALGGGVVGDLAGFIASTYMRGIDVVQVPTSLLAQVDSSIGGKCGINLGKVKNIIGSFYQPRLTYINVKALKTLPEEEFIGGMAEVIKYSLIYDYDFLDYLIENSEDILDRESENLYYIVNKCANIKAEVVDKDEKEGGLRKILNFGHTFGHGVEKLCGISHGCAVSIGMNMAFKLSLSKGFVTEEYYNKFLMVCEKYNLPLNFVLSIEDDYETKEKVENKVLNLMRSDKKNSFGKINLILPVGLGKVEVVNNVEDDELLNIIKGCQNA